MFVDRHNPNVDLSAAQTVPRASWFFKRAFLQTSLRVWLTLSQKYVSCTTQSSTHRWEWVWQMLCQNGGRLQGRNLSSLHACSWILLLHALSFDAGCYPWSRFGGSLQSSARLLPPPAPSLITSCFGRQSRVFCVASWCLFQSLPEVQACCQKSGVRFDTGI